MINVVIPMAGQGSRFIKAGYKAPKPFIEANGKTLIEIVLSNLNVKDANFILLARSEHLSAQAEVVRRIHENFNVTFIPVDRLTEGSACTALYANRIINNDTPLLLANSDQYIASDINEFINDCKNRGLDGSILTFEDKDRDPKWSFAKIDTNGMVDEVREKFAISNYATVGIYYFSRGRSFIESAIEMILANDRVNGEFYTCPVYNYSINAGQKIGIYNIDAIEMFGLGTPKDLERFLEHH